MYLLCLALLTNIVSTRQYVAPSMASQEAIWLRCLLNDMSLPIKAPTVIYEDNNGAIELSKNAKNHNKTLYIL